MNKKTIWRFIAIGCTLVWLIVIFNNLAYFDNFGMFLLQPNWKRIILQIITVLGCIWLIIFPLQFSLYAVLCCSWGIISAIEGGTISTLLMYLLGIAFAERADFFKTQKKIKIFFLIFAITVAIASQYRFGLIKLINTFNILLLIITAGVILFFLYKYPYNNTFKREKNKIYLSDFNLSISEINLLKDVALGKKYQHIALEKKVSESVIKKRMNELFKKINVANNASFKKFLEDDIIIFPDS